MKFVARILLENGKSVEIDGPADIINESTDAIVNAANSSLLGGGGVDGSIHRAGGPAILSECREIVARIGRLAAGQAVTTGGGRLRAKYVIHTVGPIYQGPDDAAVLASCYRESLRQADEKRAGSIAFPSISTGAYGYPLAEAAPVAISAVVEGLRSSARARLARFVLFDRNTLQAYLAAGEQFTKQTKDSSLSFERAGK